MQAAVLPPEAAMARPKAAAARRRMASAPCGPARSGDRAGHLLDQLPGVLAELAAPFLVEASRLQLRLEGLGVDGRDLHALVDQRLLDIHVRLGDVLALLHGSFVEVL